MLYLIGLAHLQRHPLAGAFLVRHPRSGRLPLQRRHHALLDRGRTQHAAVLLVAHSAGGVFLYNRLLWGSVGLLALVALWKFFPMSVEALTTRSSGKRAALARAQDSRRRASAQPGRGEASRRAPGLRPGHHLRATRLAHPPADLQHRARSSVLGHRHPDGRPRPQQRPLRRPRRRAECLARHLPHAASRGRRRDALLLHRRHALRRRTRLARARHPLLRHPRRAAHCRDHRLVLETLRPLLCRIRPAHRRGPLRHPHADHRRLLSLRARCSTPRNCT